MLFRKKIERSCAYCTRGTVLEDGQVLCTVHGACSREKGCRKFRYDPCKRIPKKQKALDFSQYNREDFSLDCE